MGRNRPLTYIVGKLFFGQDYENNVDTKFSINLGARWGFLLLLFHPPANVILGPPKHQKFRYFPWFCHNGGKFVNSPWRYQIQLSCVRKTILITYVSH